MNATARYTLVYDGDGNRVKKTVGTTTTYYLVDDRNPTGYAQVLEEQPTAGGTPTVTYSYALDLLNQARGGTVAFLSMLPPSAGERSAQHAEIGKFTLSEMLHEWANHDLGHLRQIAELFRAREFYLYAGSFQKYSNPKP